MATPEGKVKTDIKKWLKAHGFQKAGDPAPEWPIVHRGFYWMPPQNGYGVGGIPDFVGSFAGLTEEHDRAFAVTVWRPFAIEAKAPGGKATDLQLERHAEMRAAGWLVLVVDDVSQLAELERYMA